MIRFVNSAAVQNALAKQLPIVALESTVIAHGLPRPQNLETALRLERIVREAGATPATIAVLDGAPHIGLEPEQLSFLAESNDIHKLSRRDLPVALARKQHGATTVATTAFFAGRAGIRVFATGGIGGVHRGAPADVSADLPELADTPITVVCAGAKSVLDLAATREWLETAGIAVIGYGCDELPAFYSRSSGLAVDARVDSPAEAAKIIRSRDALELEQAVLIVVPVPSQAEVSVETVETILHTALAEAEQQNITGKDATPFLLRRLAENSNGATLRANLALLENNAQIAAQIAVALKEGQ